MDYADFERLNWLEIIPQKGPKQHFQKAGKHAETQRWRCFVRRVYCILQRLPQDPMNSTARDNVDLSELAKFDALASRWWDTEGEFRPLHQINPDAPPFFILQGAIDVLVWREENRFFARRLAEVSDQIGRHLRSP